MEWYETRIPVECEKRLDNIIRALKERGFDIYKVDSSSFFRFCTMYFRSPRIEEISGIGMITYSTKSDSYTINLFIVHKQPLPNLIHFSQNDIIISVLTEFDKNKDTYKTSLTISGITNQELIKEIIEDVLYKPFKSKNEPPKKP